MRLDNWDLLLMDYIESQQNQPFIWGVNDCCHFAAKGAEIITGVGVGHLYPCDSALSAQRLLNDHGGVEGIADKHYTRRDNKNFTQRGDVVSAAVGVDELGLGICTGTDAVFKSENGLFYLPMINVLSAWEIV